MNKYGSTVFWSEQDGGYIAACSEIQGISGLGETPEEAVHQLGVAVELAIETYEEEGWELPAPRDLAEYSGQFRLRVPKSLHARLARQAKLEGVSLNTYVVSRLSDECGRAEEQKAANKAPLSR